MYVYGPAESQQLRRSTTRSERQALSTALFRRAVHWRQLILVQCKRIYAILHLYFYVRDVDVQGTRHLPPPRRRTRQLISGRGGCARGENVGVCQSAAAAVMVGGVFVCSGTATVGQAAVAQAWEHGDRRGGMATQLARSATAGRSSVGSSES